MNWRPQSVSNGGDPSAHTHARPKSQWFPTLKTNPPPPHSQIQILVAAAIQAHPHCKMVHQLSRWKERRWETSAVCLCWIIFTPGALLAKEKPLSRPGPHLPLSGSSLMSTDSRAVCPDFLSQLKCGKTHLCWLLIFWVHLNLCCSVCASLYFIPDWAKEAKAREEAEGSAVFGCSTDVKGSLSDCSADPSLSPFDSSHRCADTNTLRLRLSPFACCLATCYFLQTQVQIVWRSKYI